MQPSGNTILITGGSAGIGRALAERFHAAGNKVIITGRRQGALDAVTRACPGMVAYAADMADGQATVDLAARVIADHPALNVVIANAGIMRVEDPTTRRDLTDAEETVETNLLGPIRLIDALVDHLKARQNSAIVTVTSGLGHVPLVFAPTYSATKAAIHSYTLSLRQLLAGQVEVIELVPPGVQTDLTPGQATRDGYMPLRDFIDEVMALLSQQPTPPEILVDRVKGLRFAEAEGRTQAALDMLTENYRAHMPDAG